MNKFKVLFLGFGVTALLLIGAMFYYSSYIQPRIEFTAKITGISTQEYKTIVENKQVDVSNRRMDEFRKISVSILVSQPFGVDFRIKINRDILMKYLSNSPEIQIVTGGSFEHGNGREYAENAEVLLNGMSDEGLREVLKNFKYRVSWKDIWNAKKDEAFYMKDYLKQ